MKKFWLIFTHEYARHVFRWRFLFLLISPSLSGIFFGGVLFAVYAMQVNRDPVGYVDKAHIITTGTFPAGVYTPNPLIQLDFLPYPDELAARKALDQKDIQAYYVIPSDYRQTGNARLVYYQLPFAGSSTLFNNLLRVNLMADQSTAVTHRVITGSRTEIVTTADKQKELINRFLQLGIPIGLSYIMFFSVTLCSGYLVQAVVEEKENRTIEILATSASPVDIITGKIFGLVSVGLTQLVIWIGTPLLFILVLAALFPAFHAAVNWVSIALLLLTIIPTFFLVSTIIVMIIVAFGEYQEGQAITFLVLLPTMLPYLLIETLSVEPSSALAVFLSFFPITAANTLAVRVAFSSVPASQILLSAGLLILCTVASFWLTGKAFKKWMLRSWILIDWKRLHHAVSHARFRKGTV